MKYITTFFYTFFLSGPLNAAQLIIDSFDENDFVLTRNPGGNAFLNSGPIGDVRSASLNSREIPLATVVSAQSTSDLGGSLSLSVDGASAGVAPIRLRLSYGQGGPFSLLDNRILEFNFNSILGEGNLLVSLGFSNFSPDLSETRIQMSDAGLLRVDASDFVFGDDDTLHSFDYLAIIFEAETEQFEFTLEEIRAIPEPSSSLMIALAIGWGCLKRRRCSSRIGR